MFGKITGSIVIYKSNPDMLKKTITSFLQSTEDSILYLIDNSPTRWCKQQFRHRRIRYIFNNKNIGFGAGHNIALREVLLKEQPDYHLVLNPDVYFEKSVIEKLYAFMEENHQVGLIMPKVLYPDGRLQPLCKLLPSPLTLFSRRFLHFNSNWINKMNYLYEMHFSGYNKVMDVPFLSGCFMFLRIDTLRQIGIFDEQMFLYTEDTDLTRRIHQYYRTVFYPHATIYHYNQRGSYKSTGILMHHVISAIKYFNKWGWFTDQERSMINERVILKLIQ